MKVQEKEIEIMTLNIDGYEVKITVRDKHSDRANMHDLGSFLTTLLIMAYESEEIREMRGLTASAKVSHGIWTDIYEALKAKGFYEKD